MSKTKIEDGVYPVYVKDGVSYPVALTQDQHQMFQMLVASISKVEPIRVVFSQPLGEAVNLADQLKRSVD